MKLLFHWILSAAAIMIAAHFVPGAEASIRGAFLAAVVLGVLNLFLRPIILIFTLPITLLTLGLFSLVINAALVLLASYVMHLFAMSGFVFVVGGFVSALWFSIALTVINWVFHLFTPHD
jgi:putative membrane protein